MQGKTIQAIALVAYLIEFKQKPGPYLVIVPLSTLSNWQNEFAKWCPGARLVCYKGTPAQRKALYRDQVKNGHFNVLLTTYEYIIKDKSSLRKTSWELSLVDEGTKHICQLRWIYHHHSQLSFCIRIQRTSHEERFEQVFGDAGVTIFHKVSYFANRNAAHE